MSERPKCPLCGSSLSFIVDIEKDTGEVTIIVDCEFCGEYAGFMMNTHMTQKDFNIYKGVILKKPRLWLVEITQEE